MNAHAKRLDHLAMCGATGRAFSMSDEDVASIAAGAAALREVEEERARVKDFAQKNLDLTAENATLRARMEDARRIANAQINGDNFLLVAGAVCHCEDCNAARRILATPAPAPTPRECNDPDCTDKDCRAPAQATCPACDHDHPGRACSYSDERYSCPCTYGAKR